MKRLARIGGAGFLLVLVLLVPDVSVSEGADDLDALTVKVNEQEATIQQQQQLIEQLANQMGALEARLGRGSAPAPVARRPVSLDADEIPSLAMGEGGTGLAVGPQIEIDGYIDIGYVDAAGSGSVASSATGINSRGDTLAAMGLDGDSSFLINEINLNFSAGITEELEALVSLDLLPRDLSFTTSGGTAGNDTMEIDLAFIAYKPWRESDHPLARSLFGEGTFLLGKFQSPFGIEPRVNESPDRVNISRSQQSVYTVGYPVGVGARGKLFKDWFSERNDSFVGYNLALANSDPFTASFGDGDVDNNSSRTILGRLSYGQALGAETKFETGVTLLNGALVGQGDNKVTTEAIGVDAELVHGPLTLRGEWDFSDEDAPRTGGSGTHFTGVYFAGFYEIARPDWLPPTIPMTSLTPYYRYDTRDLATTSTSASPGTFNINVNRHTFAMRYGLRPGSLLKGEYQVNGEAEGASVNDNAFLMSYVQQF